MKFSKRFYNKKENTEALKISNKINNIFVKQISETKSQIIINSNLKNESYEYNTDNKVCNPINNEKKKN